MSVGSSGIPRAKQLIRNPHTKNTHAMGKVTVEMNQVKTSIIIVIIIIIISGIFPAHFVENHT